MSAARTRQLRSAHLRAVQVDKGSALPPALVAARAARTFQKPHPSRLSPESNSFCLPAPFPYRAELTGDMWLSTAQQLSAYLTPMCIVLFMSTASTRNRILDAGPVVTQIHSTIYTTNLNKDVFTSACIHRTPSTHTGLSPYTRACGGACPPQHRHRPSARPSGPACASAAGAADAARIARPVLLISTLSPASNSTCNYTRERRTRTDKGDAHAHR